MDPLKIVLIAWIAVGIFGLVTILRKIKDL